MVGSKFLSKTEGPGAQAPISPDRFTNPFSREKEDVVCFLTHDEKKTVQSFKLSSSFRLPIETSRFSEEGDAQGRRHPMLPLFGPELLLLAVPTASHPCASSRVLQRTLLRPPELQGPQLVGTTL